MAKTVKNSKKTRIKRNPKLAIAWMVLMPVFIVELLFAAWCVLQSNQIERDIIQQTQKAAQQAATQDKLKIELARLKSPQRIAKIAREQLGLITPAPGQTIIIP